MVYTTRLDEFDPRVSADSPRAKTTGQPCLPVKLEDGRQIIAGSRCTLVLLTKEGRFQPMVNSSQTSDRVAAYGVNENVWKQVKRYLHRQEIMEVLAGQEAVDPAVLADYPDLTVTWKGVIVPLSGLPYRIPAYSRLRNRLGIIEYRTEPGGHYWYVRAGGDHDFYKEKLILDTPDVASALDRLANLSGVASNG